jgi:hypothetical protein
MPDGNLTLTLSDETASRIAEKAKALGMPVEHLAAMLLDQHFFDPRDVEWSNGDPDQPLPPLDVNEPTHAWEKVKDELQAQRADARRKRA